MTSSVASLLMVLGLWFCLTVFCCGSRSISTADNYTVTYQVTGNNTHRTSLTYSSQGGGTAQEEEIILPWTKTFTVNSGDFLYLSAQNKNSYGSITTRISINGSVRKTTTSEGGFVIATSSYRCCD